MRHETLTPSHTTMFEKSMSTSQLSPSCASGINLSNLSISWIGSIQSTLSTTLLPRPNPSSRGRCSLVLSVSVESVSSDVALSLEKAPMPQAGDAIISESRHAMMSSEAVSESDCGIWCQQKMLSAQGKMLTSIALLVYPWLVSVISSLHVRFPPAAGLQPENREWSPPVLGGEWERH